MTSLPHLAILTVLGLTLNGCSSKSTDNVNVTQDSFVEFTSRAGNSITHPAQWKANDNGDSFTLTSPDDQAIINVLTFAVEGTGTISEFQSIIESQVDGDWIDSDWMDFSIGDTTALRRELVAFGESGDSEWLIYTMQRGDCYHALLLNASSLAMSLNRDFYENIIRSFVGISAVP